MQLLKRRITTPAFDTLAMVLVGWTLLDAGAVPVHPTLSPVLLVAGFLCFIIAGWSWWRRPRAN